MNAPKPDPRREARRHSDKAKRRRFRGLEADQRQADRREKLIEAAIECFGKFGFHDVTVRQLCAEAKLTERYFYESFENREALFTAAYEQVVKRLRETVIAAIIASPREVGPMSRAGLRALFETIYRDPRTARILFVDVFNVSANMDRKSREATQSFSELLKQLIGSVFPVGEKAGLDPELMANGLAGACIYVAMQWTFEEFRQPLDAVVENCAAMFEAMNAHAQKLSKIPSAATPLPPKKRR
jgi:AcrR family transcriptional regulator